MSLKDTLKKQGGLNLLLDYIHNRVFFTAVNQFLVLGHSRTALELLRLSTTLKVRKRLEKKYASDINIFESFYDGEQLHESSNNIWICWFQGEDNAPQLVKECIKSIRRNLHSRDIVIITSENYEEYVDFPQYIIDKWKSGIITHTHMTDLLRLELLTMYGGTWIDATVFCSEDEQRIPNYFLDSELFMYQMLKPGKDGNSQYISSWFITAKSHNKILEATKYLCYEYWKKNNRLADYFLLHDFMSIVIDHYPEDWNKVVPRDNSTPHVLLLRLFEKFDSNIWEAIRMQSPFHKLSYKFQDEMLKKKDTYYTEIVMLENNS